MKSRKYVCMSYIIQYANIFVLKYVLYQENQN